MKRGRVREVGDDAKCNFAPNMVTGRKTESERRARRGIDDKLHETGPLELEAF